MDYQPQRTFEEVSHLIELKSEEQVHLITRQHVIFFFLKAFLASLVLSLILIMGTTLAAVTSVSLVINAYWLIAYFLSGAVLLVFAIQTHNYYLSKQIVTNNRIIDYDQRGLFKAEINETFLVNLENINVVQTTIWQTLFNFGSVDVQTAGQRTEIATSGVVFENIPKPKEAAAIISKLAEEMKHREGRD